LILIFCRKEEQSESEEDSDCSSSEDESPKANKQEQRKIIRRVRASYEKFKNRTLTGREKADAEDAAVSSFNIFKHRHGKHFERVWASSKSFKSLLLLLYQEIFANLAELCELDIEEVNHRNRKTIKPQMDFIKKCFERITRAYNFHQAFSTMFWSWGEAYRSVSKISINNKLRV
jgi:hypothetical protein